jgi:excisionase family DNA binding protein
MQRQYVLRLDSRLLRLNEAAAYWGLSVSGFYTLISRGVVRPIQLPGLRGPRFDRRELDAAIEAQKGERE